MAAAIFCAVLVDRFGGQPPSVTPVVIALVAYVGGTSRAVRRWSASDVLLLGIPLIGLAVSRTVALSGAPHAVAVLWVWIFFVVAPFVAGWALANRSRLNAELAANVARLARDQKELSRLAAGAERARIARELHDVVAHGVSVMVIQTQAARHVLRDDPAAARAALSTVEQCGREALLDLRRMIGAFHRDDGNIQRGVVPGLGQLDRLVERAAVSGLDVELRVEGRPQALSPSLDLVAFRVVQEALTNAIKHAGPTSASIRVTFTGEILELLVSNEAPAPSWRPKRRTGGLGLIGMRERVSMYGGKLQTEHKRGGGYEVRAVLPVGVTA